MLKLEIDPRILEEAVTAGLRGAPARTYWREREALYGIEDPDERERAFRAMHARWFDSMNLIAPLHAAIQEAPIVLDKVELLRVLFASSKRDEDAELFVKRGEPGGGDDPVETRTVVLRLRPHAFCDPAGLLWLLRRELLRITDMLDPAFGYDPRLPVIDGGPLRLKIALMRYRVLWDTVIDGRLQQQGRSPEGAREVRLREFARAFEVLHDRLQGAFERWFRVAGPTHCALWAYSLDPREAEGLPSGSSLGRGVCPLCQCPGALRVAADLALPAGTIEILKGDFPEWTPGQGICGHCEDLYRNRARA